MKTIEINKDTGVIINEEGRIVIQQQDRSLRKLVEVSLTKEEIINLAKQLQEKEVPQVEAPAAEQPILYETSVFMAGGRSPKSIIAGKPATKRWQFMGWYPLPDLTKIKHHYKGDYLITEKPDHNGENEKTRYRIYQEGQEVK